MGGLRAGVAAAHRRSLLLMGGFAALAIVLALLFGFLISWSFIMPVQEAHEFLGQVAICELTPSIRARAVQLTKEQHLKHAERYRMCDRDGIWGRALDQRHNHRESAGADLSLCQTFGLTQRDWKTETICLASVASNGSGKLSTVFPKSTVR